MSPLATIGCDLDSYEYVHLEWDPASLGASFLQYDLDRSDDAGATWDRIAEVRTEALTEVDDVEARRNLEALYRLRSVRTDLATSPWSASEAATPTGGAEMLFTSNHAKALSVGYHVGEGKEWNFPNADRRILAEFFGRDGAVAFRPTERLGVRFPVFARVSSQSVPAAPGVDAFAPLRALSTAQLPYVCVLDQYGSRFYADVVVPQGTVTEPTRFYIAKLGVAELQFTPTPVVLV